MPVDLQKDETQLRRAVAFVSIALFVVIVTAAAVGLRPAWRRVVTSAVPGAPEATAEIRELSACGEVDRCVTCHAGALGSEAAPSSLPEPYRPHPPLREGHAATRIGCSSCHGGVGRALDARAHDLVGREDREPLMKAPYLEASCARCHIPGTPGTERLARGAERFFELGCGMCHSLAKGGRGAWDDGPELRTLGRRSVEELKTSLFDPKADFPESTMPSYEATFASHPEELVDLLLFVTSLTLEPLRRCAAASARRAGLVELGCTTCHAGERAATRFSHRCVYLIDKAAELRCGNCHQESSLEHATGDCPVVRARRAACVACHRDAEE